MVEAWLNHEVTNVFIGFMYEELKTLENRLVYEETDVNEIMRLKGACDGLCNLIEGYLNKPLTGWGYEEVNNEQEG